MKSHRAVRAAPIQIEKRRAHWVDWDCESPNQFPIVKPREDLMRNYFWFILLGVAILGGCAAMRDLLLPGDSDFDKSRRFYDQT
jgi:hypothetical protein